MNHIFKKYAEPFIRSLKRRAYFYSNLMRPTDQSQLGEAQIIMCILRCLDKQDKPISKTFLEVGANSAFNLSTTWFLEKKHGFSGVSIDPLDNFSREFRRFRRNTIFMQKALVSSDTTEKTVPFYKSDCSVLSTIDPSEADSAMKMGYSFAKTIVEVVSWSQVSSCFQQRIGVMILDIESLEAQINILRDVIISEKKPYIICVETLDFSPLSRNQRYSYDKLLEAEYRFVAGTYLNSIYLCRSIEELDRET